MKENYTQNNVLGALPIITQDQFDDLILSNTNKENLSISELLLNNGYALSLNDIYYNFENLFDIVLFENLEVNSCAFQSYNLLKFDNCDIDNLEFKKHIKSNNVDIINSTFKNVFLVSDLGIRHKLGNNSNRFSYDENFILDLEKFFDQAVILEQFNLGESDGICYGLNVELGRKLFNKNFELDLDKNSFFDQGNFKKKTLNRAVEYQDYLIQHSTAKKDIQDFIVHFNKGIPSEFFGITFDAKKDKKEGHIITLIQPTNNKSFYRIFDPNYGLTRLLNAEEVVSYIKLLERIYSKIVFCQKVYTNYNDLKIDINNYKITKNAPSNYQKAQKYITNRFLEDNPALMKDLLVHRKDRIYAFKGVAKDYWLDLLENAKKHNNLKVFMKYVLEKLECNTKLLINTIYLTIDNMHYEVYEKFFSKKYHVNYQLCKGSTLLHMACELQNLVIIRFLVQKHNASFNIKNDSGYFPIDYLFSDETTKFAKENIDFYIEFFKEFSSNFNMDQRDRIFLLAAETASEELLKLIIKSSEILDNNRIVKKAIGILKTKNLQAVIKELENKFPHLIKGNNALSHSFEQGFIVGASKIKTPGYESTDFYDSLNLNDILNEPIEYNPSTYLSFTNESFVYSVSAVKTPGYESTDFYDSLSFDTELSEYSQYDSPKNGHDDLSFVNIVHANNTKKREFNNSGVGSQQKKPKSSFMSDIIGERGHYSDESKVLIV